MADTTSDKGVSELHAARKANAPTNRATRVVQPSKTAAVGTGETVRDGPQALRPRFGALK